jgi:hypothetical protein
VHSSTVTRPRQESRIDLRVGIPSSSKQSSAGLIESACRNSSMVNGLSARNTHCNVFRPCCFLDSGCREIRSSVAWNAWPNCRGIVLRASRRSRIVVCSRTC